MNCDMCGAPDANYVILVEGTQMNVCEGCSEFGEIVKKPVLSRQYKGKHDTIKPRVPLPRAPEILEKIIAGYGTIIKKKREALELKQEDFAKMLNIKESMLHQIESERFKPNIETAKQIEKKLGIKITEFEREEERADYSENKNATLTIGDVMIKKR
jgi:uncharacterized protein (TIGR00270 family)